MEETGCSVATTPSPQPAATVTTTTTTTTTTAALVAPSVATSVVSASAADAFASPPRSNNSQPVTSATAAAAAAATAAAPQAATTTARILGRNANGTVVQTSVPQNEAELQLYRVMQRASLLSYYDTLLEMGGDDVQQLCDAGEEEFLEIMALVGMASKPLHVRRLQKALQEWLTNPAMFQNPVVVPGSSSTAASNSSSSNTSVIAPAAAAAAASAPKPSPMPSLAFSFSPRQPQQPQQHQVGLSGLGSISSASANAAKLLPSPSSNPAAVQQLLGQFSAAAGCCPLQRHKSLSPPVPVPTLGSFIGGAGVAQPSQHQAPTESPSLSALSLPLSHSPGMTQASNYESSSCGSQGTTTPSPGSNSASGGGPSGGAPPSPTSLFQMTTPVLLECQVQRLAEAAERLAASIRPLNPKPPSGIKKKICKNLEMVMAIPDSDPRRMEEIRKYAAIYGRFDCKRKPEKPLTLHEVSVNEAAAQICRFVPALLTRRDELFPLARRVVRDSGHYYTKNSLSGCLRPMSRENGDGELSGGDDTSLAAEEAKRRRLDDDTGNRENNAASESIQHQQHQQQQQQQEETTRIRLFNYSRAVSAIDPEAHLIQQMQLNRHRKRQRRRRISKIGRKSVTRLGSLTISPVWQSCSDNSNLVLDEVVGGLDHHSDGCYSSFDDEWDDCNDDGCGDDHFGIDTDDAAGNDTDEHPTSQMIHGAQSNTLHEDDGSSMVDKENDFNLKVIASCGDNIIAVANPALMNHNQPTSMTKEQSIKEEIILRDRRD